MEDERDSLESFAYRRDAVPAKRFNIVKNGVVVVKWRRLVLKDG